MRYKNTIYILETFLKRQYPFLRDVEFVIQSKEETGYDYRTKTILINLSQLREKFKTPRFERRFGKIDSFKDFLLMILLHETKHVFQWKTIPDHRLFAAMREVSYDTDEGHDDCWIEQEADSWAVQEFKRLRAANEI